MPRKIAWDRGRVAVVLAVGLELVVGGAVPLEAPASGPADSGGSSEDATGVVAGIIIAVLTLLGLFLYYWYSRRERRTEKSREAVLEQQKQAFIEEQRVVQDEENPRVQASLPPPQPVTNESANSPPFTGGSECENNNLVSTFNSNPVEVSNGNQYDLKTADKVVARKSESEATLEGGRVMTANPDGTFAIQFDDGDYDNATPAMWVYPRGKFSKGDRVLTRLSRSGTIASYVGPSLYEVKLDTGEIETASSDDLTSSVYSGGALPMKRSHTTVLPSVRDEDDDDFANRKLHRSHRFPDREKASRMRLPPPSSRRSLRGLDKFVNRESLSTADHENDGLSKSLGATDALAALAGLHSVAVSPITPRTPNFRASLGYGADTPRSNGELITNVRI